MSAPITADLTFDGYRLIRFLGRGGFGEVWLCRSEAMGDLRAFKWLPAGMADRLQKEYDSLVLYRNAAAALRSPHLVPIEHINRHDSGLFYVMPLADGMTDGDPFTPDWQPKTLASLIEARAELPEWFSSSEIRALIVPILQALQTLSDAGLVHRDVKPENVLFFNGSPCLCDISLLGEDAALITRRGTPGYSTPSWYVGGNPDMFGAAATLYTLLTGNFPDKMGRAAFIWPPQGEESLSETERAEWKRLHAVIRRATDEKVSERYVDFRTMADALTAESTIARPPALPPQSKGKRKLLVWASSVVAALVLMKMMAGHSSSSGPVRDETTSPPAPTPVAPSTPAPRRPIKIVDSQGQFTSVREKVIDAIPAALYPMSPPAQKRLNLREYAETQVIVKSYRERDYASCIDLLEKRMESLPDLHENPYCLMLKALLFKQLERTNEIDGVLKRAIAIPLGSPSRGHRFFSDVTRRLVFLEALARHEEAEALVTTAIDSSRTNLNIAGAGGFSPHSADMVALFNQRARVRILRGDYAGALEDEFAALALPAAEYYRDSGSSPEEIKQVHLNTIVMQWELLEQEFPSYAAYLEANGSPEPQPDHRNLKAVD